jgi:cellobiose phosphorylase
VLVCGRRWPACKIHYRYRRTVYHITLTRPAADATATNLLSLDGQELKGDTIPLQDDGREHAVEMKVR